jgi:hypothetical protein
MLETSKGIGVIGGAIGGASGIGTLGGLELGVGVKGLVRKANQELQQKATLLMAFSVNHTNFNKNAISFYG